MKKLKTWFFTFWIDNYKVSFLFLALIVFAGILAMIQIPKESNPDIKFGIISVTTPYSGVNPQDIDSLITEKIEDKLEDIDWVSKITSTSSVGISSVVVELENWVSTRDAMTDIRDKIDTLSLPSEADETIVQEISISSELLFEALIYSDVPLSNFALNQKTHEIRNALEGTSGISEIVVWWAGWDALSGWSSSAWDYDIKVLVSKEKLELFDLSMAQISNTIRSFNKNTPVWNYTIWELNYDFRFDWEFNDVIDLENTIIRWDGSSVIRLWDVAEIVKEYDEDVLRSLGSYELAWKNYITLSFNKESSANIFSASRSSKLALEEFLDTKPWFENIYVKYSQDLGAIIIEDYKNLWNTAVQTLILVFITIFIFVGIRESLIASILLPLAFFITFIVLNVMWFTLNFLTNFSLVLTLWIAIDTIIVIIEWASERQKLGYERRNAVILAMQDLKSPLISWTFTTLVAFLPMIFLPGLIWKFLSYIPITVFITLLAALVLSLTLSWALFYKLASKKNSYHSDPQHELTFSDEELKFLEAQRQWKTKIWEEKHNYREKMLGYLWNIYTVILSRVLKTRFNRLFSIISPLVVLVLTFVFLAPQIWFTLFPASDEWVINISIEWKNGATKETLEPYVTEIEEVLSAYEEMKVYYVSLSWNAITVYVELTDAKQRERAWLKTVFQVEEEILDSFATLESQWLLVEVKSVEWWPPAWSPVGIKLIANSSDNIDTLKVVADEFKTYLQTIPGTKNVSVSSSENPGQFVFELDRNKLSFAWLTPDDLLSEIRFYTSGVNSGSIQSTYEDNDIIISVDEFENTLNPTDIINLIIPTKIWNVRIWDYTTYAFVPGLSSIWREDGKITISANSDLETWVVGTEIQPKLIDFAESYNFPEGIWYIAWWENEENADLIASTIQSFAISLFLIFSILVFQFNSYSQPIIILYSVVLALLWVNIWLFVTGNPYSMTFGIWFIALTWVVVNDAIILIDRINRNLDRLVRNSGAKVLKLEDYTESIIAAGKSRLQPIIVTTLTTLFGIWPLALQDAFWAGLWYTIIFGLFAGSLMTLFVTPALYYTIYLRKKMV